MLISIPENGGAENAMSEADFVEANFWPEENVVDPGDSFNIVIELKNKKSFPIYFIKINIKFNICSIFKSDTRSAVCICTNTKF